MALVCGASPATAQPTAKVELEADRNIARVGQQLQVEVRITLQGTSSYDQFFPPRMDGFRVDRQGGVTHQTSWINGRVSATRGQVYVVTPLREGTLSLGPAVVRLGSKNYRSAVIKLKVLAGQAPAPDHDPNQDPDRSDHDPALPGGGGEELPALFVNGTARPGEVFVGQQVVLSWNFYSRQLLNLQVTKQPSTTDFWSEELEGDKNGWRRTTVRGMPYFTIAVMRRALFPQKTGKLTIGAMDVRATVGFFESASRTSEPVTVTVKPLPEAGRPDDFSPGNVGHYIIAATLDRDDVQGSQAVKLKLVVQGEGNLNQLKMPKLTALDGFKVYEPREELRVTRRGKVAGEKLHEILLIPTRSGRLTIPPVTLNVFDTVQKRYRALRTERLTLNVRGKVGDDGHRANVGPGTKNVLGPGIRPPRSAVALSHRTPFRPLRSRLFWVLLALPATLLLLVTLGERLRAQLRRETPSRQRRAAWRRVKVHLDRAKQSRKRSDRSGFFAEIAAALRDLLDLKLATSTDGLTRQELSERMTGVGLSPEIAQDVVAELDNCDFARFAPSASGDAQMAETLTRARKLLARLNRASTRAERGGAA